MTVRTWQLEMWQKLAEVLGEPPAARPDPPRERKLSRRGARHGRKAVGSSRPGIAPGLVTGPGSLRGRPESRTG